LHRITRQRQLPVVLRKILAAAWHLPANSRVIGNFGFFSDLREPIAE
jgi:hypothetical protein